MLNKKFDLAQDENPIITKVTELLDKSYKRDDRSLLDQFVNCLFNFVSAENIFFNNIGNTTKIAISLFEFVHTKPASMPNIRCYNLVDMEKEDRQSKYTILEIHNNDSPFLLDSLKAELFRNEISIYEILHPILEVKRGSSSEALEFSLSKVRHENLESVMHLQVTFIEDNFAREKLVKDLQIIFSNIREAVQDWQKMLNQLGHINQSILEHEDSDNIEAKQFLSWLASDNFTFLGYVEYSYNSSPVVCHNSQLGIMKLDHLPVNEGIKDEIFKVANNVKKKPV